MGYLANFMVYTFAMIGVIAIALLVFKSSNNLGGSSKAKHLKVIDTLTIAPRKTLYVVSTGTEKFLIAGDVSKTTLISKLETNSKTPEPISHTVKEECDTRTTFQETMANLPKSKYMDRQKIGIKSSLMSQVGENRYNSVMKNLAERIKC